MKTMKINKMIRLRNSKNQRVKSAMNYSIIPLVIKSN